MAGFKIYKDEELAGLFFVPIQREPIPGYQHRVTVPFFELIGKKPVPCYGCDIEKLLGKRVATASEIVIEKMADTVQEFIVNGQIKIEELDILVTQGLHPDVIARWKAKYQVQAKTSGLTCCRCNEFFPYADTPNQPDGSFKCYGCRS